MPAPHTRDEITPPVEPALRLEWMDPKELAENPRNWRKHPALQLSAISDLLGEVGWAAALLYNESTKRLLDGYARKKVTKDSKVPVLIGNWALEPAAKIMLRLDPLTSLAEADGGKIKELLALIKTESEAVATLFATIAGEDAWQSHNQPNQIVDPEPQFDKAAELQAKWGTARGQAWEIGPHRLICGDCRDLATVRRLWAEGWPKIPPSRDGPPVRRRLRGEERLPEPLRPRESHSGSDRKR